MVDNSTKPADPTTMDKNNEKMMNTNESRPSNNVDNS